jgi:hypothetical protein
LNAEVGAYLVACIHAIRESVRLELTTSRRRSSSLWDLPAPAVEEVDLPSAVGRLAQRGLIEIVGFVLRVVLGSAAGTLLGGLVGLSCAPWLGLDAVLPCVLPGMAAGQWVGLHVY